MHHDASIISVMNVIHMIMFLVAACSSINVVGAACRPPCRLVCKYAEQKSRTNRSTPKQVAGSTASNAPISRLGMTHTAFCWLYLVEIDSEVIHFHIVSQSSWADHISKSSGQEDKVIRRIWSQALQYEGTVSASKIVDMIIWYLISLTVDKYISRFAFFFNMSEPPTESVHECVSVLPSKLIKVAANNWMSAMPVIKRYLEPCMDIAESSCLLPAWHRWLEEISQFVQFF